MSTDRLGRSAHQSLRAFLRRRPHRTPAACHFLSAVACHLQWLGVRCSALEVYASAEGSTSSTWRDSTSLLHRDQQKRRGYHRRGNLQCHAGSSGAVFQQDTMLLLRRAEVECRGNGRYACFLLYRPRLRERPSHEEHRYRDALIYLL